MRRGRQPRAPRAAPQVSARGGPGADQGPEPHEVRVRGVPASLRVAGVRQGARHGNRSDVFLTMHLDPQYEQILVETFTLAQAAAIVRAARARGA